MTAQLLSSELSNLVQESKRKHADLRIVRLCQGFSKLLVFLLTELEGCREVFGRTQIPTEYVRGSDSCRLVLDPKPLYKD